MKNFVRPGKTVTVVAPENIKAGDGVIVGSIFDVAATDALFGVPVEIVVEGVFALNKTAGALTRGQVVYWTVGSGSMLGFVGTSGTLKIGVVVDAAGASDAMVNVRLNESFG
jgi:predicted RecA/RadA family phage recombinase